MILRGPPASGPSDQARPNLWGPVDPEFCEVLTPFTLLGLIRRSDFFSSFGHLGPNPAPCNIILFSISPLIPPERNPGHGHQIVADIQNIDADHSRSSPLEPLRLLYQSDKRWMASQKYVNILHLTLEVLHYFGRSSLLLRAGETSNSLNAWYM